MIDINELRRLGEGQQWIGRWYDAGCETLMAERDGEHEEVAHPIPIGLVPYLIAVQPASILELLDRLEAAESDGLEQALLLGMSGEREAALLTKLEAAEKERDKYKLAYSLWREKTEWVQEGINSGAISPKYLGWHRADVVSDLLKKAEKERDALRTELKETWHRTAAAENTIKSLQAKIEAMERQEPVAWMLNCQTLSGDTGWILSWTQSGAGLCNRLKGEENEKRLYALPGAQPAPSVPEGFALVNATHFLAVLDREDWRTAKNRAELRAMLAAAPKPEGE